MTTTESVTDKAGAIELFREVKQLPLETRLENFRWQHQKNILQVHNDSVVVRIDSISGQSRILVYQPNPANVLRKWESPRPLVFDITPQEYGAIAHAYNNN